MGIEGNWWLLEEDEDLSFERGRVYQLFAGKVLDGRTGDPLGSYALSGDGVDLLMDERHGERQIIKFRMPFSIVREREPFDPSGDGFDVRFSTERFEAYQASRPANDHETDEEVAARLNYEGETFGFIPGHGFVYREFGNDQRAPTRQAQTQSMR